MTTLSVIKKGETLIAGTSGVISDIFETMKTVNSFNNFNFSLFKYAELTVFDNKNETMLLSEFSLAKDWNTKEEDEAWKNL